MSTTLIPYADYDEEFVPEELAELGSFNHSYVQARLTLLFAQAGNYSVLTELSLSTARLQDETLRALFRDSVKPDVCVYEDTYTFMPRDVLRMEEMPLLAVEILSPMQATEPLLDKVNVYFALGVQSVWIVYPTPRTITVYTSVDQFQSYSFGDVEDKTLGISLPLSDIFR